jgi:hypothetical protein
MWQHDERFDSLDFRLYILSEDNFLLAISWESEFHQFEISSDQNHLPTSNGYQCIDVSKVNRWGDFLNTKITDVRIVWSCVKESGLFKRKIIYP